MRRLNLWQRLGLAMTGLWVVISGAYWITPISKCWGQSGWLCGFIASNPSASSAPFWAIASAMQLWRFGVVGNGLFAVIVLPTLAWGTAYLIIYAIRWIWAGRKIST